MEVEIRHLDILMDKLFEKTDLPVHVKAFRAMAEKINGEISQKYLYESIHLKKDKARKKKIKAVKLHDGKLDELAAFLGFRNFRKFIESIDKPLDPILIACTGTYYSYVRRNDDKAKIIRSPVVIKEENGKFWFELQGPIWKYKGELKLRNGCLFVLMEAENGEKMIHHVYKIGTRLKPNVLQGIFSGVSTSFDPIGGRTVLLRTDTKGTNKEATATEFLKSDIPEEKKIAKFLWEFSQNNLRINRTVTFQIDDLES